MMIFYSSFFPLSSKRWRMRRKHFQKMDYYFLAKGLKIQIAWNKCRRKQKKKTKLQFWFKALLSEEARAKLSLKPIGPTQSLQVSISNFNKNLPATGLKPDPILKASGLHLTPAAVVHARRSFAWSGSRFVLRLLDEAFADFGSEKWTRRFFWFKWKWSVAHIVIPGQFPAISLKSTTSQALSPVFVSTRLNEAIPDETRLETDAPSRVFIETMKIQSWTSI